MTSVFSLSLMLCLNMCWPFHYVAGDAVQVGPFSQTGLDLRPVLFIHRYSTMLIFAQGEGIAVARTLIETREENVGSLSLGLRQQTRLFYSAARPSLIAFKVCLVVEDCFLAAYCFHSKWPSKLKAWMLQEKFPEWEARKVDVRTIVESDSGENWDGYVGSLSTLWDEDDIEYDPETTAAIVCVENAQRDSVRVLLQEAGIPAEQTVFWEA